MILIIKDNTDGSTYPSSLDKVQIEVAREAKLPTGWKDLYTLQQKVINKMNL